MLTFFVLAGGVLSLAYAFSDISQQYDRTASRPIQAFDLFYSTSYRLNTLDTTLILKEDAQFVHIYYFIDNIRKDNPFIAMIIPYAGVLTDGNHGWKYESMPHGSTLIYKKFSCDDVCNYNPYEDYYGTPDGNDQYNLLFEINGKIDSRNAGEHALNVPVHGITSEVNIYVQENIIQQKGYQWRTSFHNVTNTAKLAVSIPEEATSLNFFPEGAHIRYVNLQSSNRTIFEWDISDDRTAFHLDYSIPSEKEQAGFFSDISILFTGIGTPLIIAGIVEFVKSRIKK